MIFTSDTEEALTASVALVNSAEDPDNLETSDKSQMNFGSDRKKKWKDIWGAGQSVSGLKEVVPVHQRGGAAANRGRVAAGECGLGAPRRGIAAIIPAPARRVRSR